MKWKSQRLPATTENDVTPRNTWLEVTPASCWVADYRHAALTACQQVEDNLTTVCKSQSSERWYPSRKPR
jgi:hypothetical protein